MRRRFFWGMVGVALLTVVVGGVTAAVLINRSVEASIRSEFARQAEATGRLIENELDRAPVGPVAAARSLGDLLRVVAAVGGHDFVEAALVSPRGLVTTLGESTVLIDQVSGLSTLGGPVHFDTTIDGNKVVVIAEPFATRGRGTVVVVLGTTLELIPWNEVLFRFAVALALAVVVAALLAQLFARRAGKRLEQLRDATVDIAGGDLGARVAVEGGDEVAEVGAAFNAMANQLQEARRREREFLVSVGHDLRTPLTTIAGYSEAIQEGKVADHDLPRVGSVLAAESSRLGRLVEDLMLLARIEAREFSLRPEEVDLAGHLKGVLEGFRGRADAARVALQPDIEDVGIVMVDPDRIAQVVGNLLENALRYTPEAGTVRLGLRRAGRGLVIEVADTGPGIEGADVPHVFERLYVTNRYRAVRPEGSGLGLSIVRELAAAMGALTEVDTAPGRGTTIRVVLPSR
ncbi:MAG TPA: HAMP domain-containing sensor histidine kinase [Acidimicrobiia bacterium]